MNCYVGAAFVGRNAFADRSAADGDNMSYPKRCGAALNRVVSAHYNYVNRITYIVFPSPAT